MDSFMPWASGPQAVVCASRVASASEDAEAVAVFCAFANATVTVHSTLWDANVDQSRKLAKTSTTSRVRSFPGRVKSASRVAGLPGTGLRLRNRLAGHAVPQSIRYQRLDVRASDNEM